MGRLSDLLGRVGRSSRPATYLFTGASLVYQRTTPGLGVLIAARAVPGLGAAVMMAVAVAVVGETVTKNRVGSAMGLMGTMSALGTTFGPSLGGILIAGFGWRAIFLANVPIGLLNLYFTHRYLGPSPIGRKNSLYVSIFPAHYCSD